MFRTRAGCQTACAADHSTAPIRPSPLTSTSGRGSGRTGIEPEVQFLGSRHRSPASRMPASPAVVTTRTSLRARDEASVRVPARRQDGGAEESARPWSTLMSPERVRGSSGHRRYASAARRAETSRSDVRSASAVATSASIVALSRCAFASWEETTATDPAPTSSTMRPAATTEQRRAAAGSAVGPAARAPASCSPARTPRSAADASRKPRSIVGQVPVAASTAIRARPAGVPRGRGPPRADPSAFHASAAVATAREDARALGVLLEPRLEARPCGRQRLVRHLDRVGSSALTSRELAEHREHLRRVRHPHRRDFDGTRAADRAAVRAQGHQPQEQSSGSVHRWSGSIDW